jgi:hypothetical protein
MILQNGLITSLKLLYKKDINQCEVLLKHASIKETDELLARIEADKMFIEATDELIPIEDQIIIRENRIQELERKIPLEKQKEIQEELQQNIIKK